MKRAHALAFLAATALSVMVGIGSFVTFEYWQTNPQSNLRPEFQLPDVSGHMRSISEWDGQLIVLNFWASWCPPCLREIPLFVQTQRRYAREGVQFVGIAIDRRDAAKTFTEKLGINYPVLFGSMSTLELLQRYGNSTGTLPYTVLIDRNRTIRQTFNHEVDQAAIETAIRQLL